MCDGIWGGEDTGIWSSVALLAMEDLELYVEMDI